jgi:7-carboxy-7-deazaguanine synthase
MDDLKINEIFFSIQGESSLVGWPTVFIRTSGCHLRCSYCDTQYAYNEGKLMGMDMIIAQVKSFQTRHVCVTGGEPLLQKNSLRLMRQLCDLDYIVSLETSGDLSCLNVDKRVKKIIDVKTPDSGEPQAFCSENLQLLEDVNSEFKFVICSDDDFEWAERFVRRTGLAMGSRVLYSPSYGKVSEKWLANKILFEKSSARLQLQLHKYIWKDAERGV